MGNLVSIFLICICSVVNMLVSFLVFLIPISAATPEPEPEDEYEMMVGACVTANGQRPTRYIWKTDQFTDSPPDMMTDFLTDAECRAKCTDNDLCTGYECSSKDNTKSVCKIMLERGELSGDPTVYSGDELACYQKKNFDKKLSDFVKMGEGRCTVNGELPKVLKIFASKLNCKKQCDFFDNCYGYNWSEESDKPGYCWLWLDGPIDGTDGITEGQYGVEYGNCKKKLPINMRQIVATRDASRHNIIVGAVGIGLVSAAAVLVWNFKKGGLREDLKTLI